MKRFALLLAALAIAGGLVTGVAIGDAPTASVTPASQTVEATGPGGATASITLSATDTELNTITVVCDAPFASITSPNGAFVSNSAIAVGSTATGGCIFTDAGDSTSTGSIPFSVSVVDTTAPAISATGAIVAEATGPAGAVVGYTTPTATDAVDGTDSVGCAPASGATFAITTTTVTCTSTDAHSNTATSTFGITVQDTTAPTIHGVPATIAVGATGPGGAAVTYTKPTATDIVDGSVAVSCSPGSGATFPIGATFVSCGATDSHGNHAGASFEVDVTQPNAVLSNMPADKTVEATGPNGAVVSYIPPTATDPVNGSRAATCIPAPGSTFPFGTTSVNCTSIGASGSFTITVKDTTPPKFSATKTVVVDVNGVASSSVTYTPPTATDAVGPVTSACKPASGSSFKLGITAVKCTASDAHGNSSQSSFNVDVRDRMPPPPSPRVTLKLAGGDATLTWLRPAGTDAIGFQLVRKPGRNGAKRTIIYRGRKTSYTDSRLLPGTTYVYITYTYDRAGNLSTTGVRRTALVHAGPLSSPLNGARLAAPPLLRWKRSSGASYYNVQLWAVGAHGSKKVLSIWPTVNHLQLTPTWSFSGKNHKLTKGLYRWYVWPGIGPLALAHYGKVIGTSSFLFLGP